MPSRYAPLGGGRAPLPYGRDSLELASLASSSPDDEPDSTSDAPSSRPSISSSLRKHSLERADPLDDDPLDDHGAAAAGSAAATGSDPLAGGYHARSYSIGSTFDFVPTLFPLSSTAGAGGYAPLGASSSAAAAGGLGGAGAGGGGGGGGLGAPGSSLEKHKTLTFFNGLSLLIGMVIGSGIFSSPSQVSREVGSPGAALAIWVLAGLLSWTGAASFAELGSAIPLNGGSQVYLAKIIGELAGFLYTWVAVLVLKPGSAAMVAIIMGEYLVRAAVGAESEVAENPWVRKSVALAGLLIVAFLNCVSTRLGVRIISGLMVLKFVILIGVMATGVVVAATGLSFDGKPNLDWKVHEWFEGTSLDGSAWAMALYAGLWAYDGWDNTNFVVGEFRNPSRDLPRVIHTAMPLVILCYVLANVSYFLVLPLAVVNRSNTVAVMFGHKVFGPVGSLVFALVVSASCFGALHAATFSSSRLIYAAGKEGFIPEIFSRIGVSGHPHHPHNHHHGAGSAMTGPLRGAGSRTHRLGRRLRAVVCDEDTALFYTPIYALALNAGLSAMYVVVGEFGTLLTFNGAAGFTFYFLTVLGLIVLRIREPELERPYKTWIVTPIIFCCVSLFLLSRAVTAHPLQTAAVIGFVLAGVPVYYWRIRRRDGPVKREQQRAGRGGGAAGGRPRRWWRFWARAGG